MTFEQRLEDDEEIIQEFSGRTVHWAKGRAKDMWPRQCVSDVLEDN